MAKPTQTHHALGKNGQNGKDKWASRLETEKAGKLSWMDAGAEDLLAAVVAVTGDGAALLLSYTSDRGALAIHVLTDNGTHKLYPTRMEELTEALLLITEIASST